MAKNDRVLSVMMSLAQRARANRLSAYKPKPPPEPEKKQEEPKTEDESQLGEALEAFTTE